MNLDTIMQRAQVWRGGGAPAAIPAISSGHAQLDELLPGGGWPLGALTEILTDRAGSGALALVLPALARLSHEPRWLAWVAPPYLPYAPALAGAGVDLTRVLLIHPRAAADGLWAVEQSLRSGTCAAVLAWLADDDPRWLRRLQLAAEAGRCWGVLFRPTRARAPVSPAALRLQVRTDSKGLTVEIKKNRGGRSGGCVHVEL